MNSTHPSTVSDKKNKKKIKKRFLIAEAGTKKKNKKKEGKKRKEAPRPSFFSPSNGNGKKGAYAGKGNTRYANISLIRFWNPQIYFPLPHRARPLHLPSKSIDGSVLFLFSSFVFCLTRFEIARTFSLSFKKERDQEARGRHYLLHDGARRRE